MVYLISQLWLYLLAALALGLGFGWWSCKDSDCSGVNRPHGIIWLLALAFMLAIFAALLHWLRDMAGLWLDTALLLIAAYVLGCIIACIACCWCKRCREGQAAAPVAAAAAAVAAAKPAAAPVPPAPPVAKPFGMAADFDGRAVTVTGSVPSEADRKTLVNGAKAAMPLASVTDRLTLASGAPAGFAAIATYGLTQLGKLSSGRMSLVETKLNIEGQAPTSAAFEDVGVALRTLPAPGLLGTVAIKPPVLAQPVPQPPSMSAPVTLTQTPPAETYEMDKVENEDNIAGKRPSSFKAPRGGKADDLKQIRGIGKQNEGRLHGLGIWHFDQIAAWTSDNALWVGSFLAFPGRIEREEWIAQAKVLAAGGVTDFAKRVKAGEVATSKDDGSKGQGNVEKVDLSKGKGGTPPKA